MKPVCGPETFVIFPLGNRRFALPSRDVVELARAGVVQKFPHQTPGISGVLVRRGEVLPVWDLTQALLGAVSAPLKFWLIARHNLAGDEPTAIPVSGECQMVRSEILPAPEGSAPHVRGMLPMEDQLIEVIDISALTRLPASIAPGDREKHLQNEGRQ